jgi:hypothetical protein
MPFKLGYEPEADGCLWNLCAGAGDPNRCIIPAGDYNNWYPLDQLFLTNSGEVFFQPGRVGQWLVIDVYMQEAFLIRDFKVKRTAGVRGGIGYRTGPGRQAILGVGGLQGAYSMAVDSQGRFVFPSASAINSTTGKGTPRISRLTIDADGNSNLEAIRLNYSPPNPDLTAEEQAEIWYGYWTNSVVVDAQDNMWTSTGTTITRITTAGQITNWPTPFGNVLQIINFPDFLLCMTRNNSWDVCFKFIKATGESIRLAGMNEGEVAAYQATHGFILVDGPAINGATFHSAVICAALVLPDGNLMVGFGNGDERQFRLLKNGRVSSLIVDCTFQETQIRLGHVNNGGPEPQYITSIGGMNADGFPQYHFPVFYEPSGTGTRAVGRIVKQEISDPFPGGNVHNSEFVSQTIPATMEAGKPAHCSVTMKNTGDIPWSETEGVHLGAQNPHDNENFGTNRWLMGTAVVQPGAEFTFEFDVTVPVAGAFNFQTRMVDDVSPNSTWFGATTPNVSVNVTEPLPGENMNTVASWTTKSINILNPETFTKWRITVQAPGMVPVFTGNTQLTVTIPLPAGLAPGSYPVLVERVNTAVTVVAGSATGTLVVPAAVPVPGPVLVPDVVTITLQ